MINWERVEELKSEIGEDGFAEVADIFLEEMAEVLERLREGGEQKDIKADLHFIKGSAMNLGFTVLADLCTQGERAAGNGASVDLVAIVGIYDQSARAFQAKLAA